MVISDGQVYFGTVIIKQEIGLCVTWPSPKADVFLLAPLEEIQNL